MLTSTFSSHSTEIFLDVSFELKEVSFEISIELSTGHSNVRGSARRSSRKSLVAPCPNVRRSSRISPVALFENLDISEDSCDLFGTSAFVVFEGSTSVEVVKDSADLSFDASVFEGSASVEVVEDSFVLLVLERSACVNLFEDSFVCFVVFCFSDRSSS